MSSLLALLFFIVVLGLSLSQLSLSVSQTMVLELEMWGAPGGDFPMVFILDKYSLAMAGTVGVISCSVYIFCYSYMTTEWNTGYFFIILSFFVASMILLVFSPGLLSLLVGWDGLGLTSFLLVIYYSSSSSLSAGMLTVISNRVGDAMILVALSLGVLLSKGMSPSELTASDSAVSYLSLVGLLVAGLSTKSAQLPFSAWLPAAMAAPTPVSALVHSSTLVTAGVYIMIRFAPWLEGVKMYLLLVGSSTMLCASMSALKEGDMKKMIALSTLSQLGVMVVALGAGSPLLSFIHLIAHAFFKAMMFIGAGDLIHQATGYQNLSSFGGSAQSSPATSSCLVVAKLALCGLPFFSGFFSKELILENMSLFSNLSPAVYFVMLAGVGLTTMYSARFMVKVIIRFGGNLSISSRATTDPAICSAIAFLVIPGLGGGACLVTVFSFELGLSFTPCFTKTLVIFLIALSALSLVFAMNEPMTFSPESEFIYFLWQSPEGSSVANLTKGMAMSLSYNLETGILEQGFHNWMAVLGQKMFLSWGLGALSVVRVFTMGALSAFLIMV